MANPQVEDGFTMIADELLNAICRTRIPGEARQVFDFIIRKTWGFGKKKDQIPLSQIALATGLKKPKIIRAREKLLEMNLISIPQKGNEKHQTYLINKDFDSWKPFPKKVTFPKKGIIIPQKGNKTFPKKGPSIEKKKNIQKRLFSSDSDEFRLSKLLFDLIRQRNPGHREPNLQSWCRPIDLMIRSPKEKRSPSEIEETIRAVQADHFWQNNILSTSKLREKYDQLRLNLFKSTKPRGEMESWNQNFEGAL